MKTLTELKWTCTDPDNGQYGRQLSERVFEFKESNRLWNPCDYSPDEKTIEITIHLDHYSDSEVEDYINTYGYTLRPTYSKSTMTDVYQEYGEMANWIIAECIFEQESGQY